MPKSKVVFFCKECGNESPKWLGKCPFCGSWNSFVEEKISVEKNEHNKNISTIQAKPERLNEIVVKSEIRVDTGFEELNRVLGGGFVEGSLTLIGGEPGIGKSTLILQICDKLAAHGKVMYVSGEESASQVKLRGDRLNIRNENVIFLPETNISNILQHIDDEQPKFCIIDSIQTMYDEDITSTPGSIPQIKEVTGTLMKLAKQRNITTIVIGHVTKDGVIAGPRILEHMVDTVLYIEGERFFTHRIVRSVKNRFGSTNEIGVFNMQEGGMVEVKNMSEMFLSENNENLAGSSIAAVIEGTSTILLEVQALTSHSYYNMPRRVANGVDLNRLNMIIAVLEKRCNLSLGAQDIYVNVIGGIKILEPALDLAVAMAIVSSYKSIPIMERTAFIGEIGLTGEIRSVNNLEKRITEIDKLGYKHVVAAKKQLERLKKIGKIDIIGKENINETIKSIFS